MQSMEHNPNGVLSLLCRRFGTNTLIPYDAYIEAVLYDPAFGYYRSSSDRVGYQPKSDFYTASSLGNVFAKLVSAACQKLLPNDPLDYHFIEIGTEPSGGIFNQHDHPFAAYTTLPVGQPLSIQGPAVVFSNELFDAQPFRRFIVHQGQWRERGVLIAEDTLQEALLPPESPLPTLPEPLTEGYQLDWPSGSNQLIEALAAQPWTGLFLAFDYGLSDHELLHLRPQGTARTYRNHQLETNLLAHPGHIDITHHISWDGLTNALLQNHFAPPSLQNQEAFFMHNAIDAIAPILTTQPGQFSKEKQTLKELLHPENMGQKFQALHALRHSI